MEIPRFSTGSFDARIAGPDAGEAFQTFAAEVLRARYPGLHAYHVHGRDGGIDLEAAAQIVVECKHSDARDVQSAWKEIADRLERHLLDPAAPGQSQYAPWYATGETAITRYIFATDAELANKSRRDALRDDIRWFFDSLAARPHLVHLRDVHVEVLDWSDFDAELKARPELVFRWFPSTRPNGLTPLDDTPEGRQFRAFLSEATLPYYSRAAHLAAGAGAAPETPAEDELLAMLDPATGLIITGKGGVGKTRLTLELGRRAKQDGWLVLRVSSTFREEAIDELLMRLVQPTNVLLLIDYVEMIGAFADRIEHIEMLNATVRHRIRYIANCRTSYYRNVQTISGHVRVDVSPAAGESSPWLEQYRRAIVSRVLAASGIDITPAHLAVCRDIPVFAVFMSYLQRQKRTADLYELVKEGEFGTWIARRIQQSFGRPIGTDLAMLLSAFPMDEMRRRMLPAPMRELFERLAADGWIEPLTDGPDAGTWVTAHDALADRVILNHLENLGPAIAPFIHDLFRFAETCDSVGSVLIALQRLSEAAVLQVVDWVELFAQRLNRREATWHMARTLILQNNLLSPTERITLMERTPECWDDLVAGTELQNTLGWICKQMTASNAPQEQLDALKRWVIRSVAQINRSNYLLTRSLILFPELRPIAERWLAAHPLEFQTHYLVVAWLTQSHGPDAVARYISPWIEKYSAAPHGSFVIEAWLDHGGIGAVITDAVRAWLSNHETREIAQFVYRAWLDATRDRTIVEEPICRWLVHHAEAEVAQFVYRAWLDATRDRTLVEEPIRRWLAHYAESENAKFVYRAWLEATSDRTLVEEPIRRWLAHYAESENAKFVYRAWLDATRDRTIVEEPIRSWLAHHDQSEAAQFVYRAWLDADGPMDVVEPDVIKWINRHIGLPELDFLIVAYLKRGGPLRPIREAAIASMTRLRESRDAAFVSKVLARQPDLPDQAVLDILAWCKHFADDRDALWRFSQLAEKIARPGVAGEAFAIADLIVRPWLEPTSSPNADIANNVTHALAALPMVIDVMMRERAWVMLTLWLRHPRGLTVANRCRRGLAGLLIEHVNRLLEHGVMDVATDAKALSRFADWARRCDPESLRRFDTLPEWFSPQLNS